MQDVRIVQDFHPGASTASGFNVSYRLGKLQQRGILVGRWLDFGCADGGYTSALLAAGADSAVGIDTEGDRIAEARTNYAGENKLSFVHNEDATLPFSDNSFDGCFMNEVLEHVYDEVTTLRELFRVLRPGGYLVVISPNRGFPFECHGAQIGPMKLGFPVPLLPWLPPRLGQRFMNARNYWPSEMRALVALPGFLVASPDFVWPVLDFYRWLPGGLRQWYLRHIARFDSMPVIRRLGVSVLLVAQKPALAPSRA
jgi:SAM-dependent methyltransferase